MKKIIFLLLSFCVSTAFSQNVSEEDAINFLESYFNPLSKSLGAGLNNGWYNTAKPHKLGGFDVTLTLNAVSVPDEDLYFIPGELDNFSSSNTSPTILGSGEGSNINYNDEANFTMPNQEIKKNLIPVPMINAGIGLIKETEINIRYIPTYDYKLGFAGEGSIALWGIGIKHDLLQWIPTIGDLIPINLSLQLGHTSLNTQFGIDAAGVNQTVELNVQATTVNLIMSKKILMLTAYAGIGYNASKTNFNTNTSFALGSENNSIDFDVPLEIQFRSQNEMRTNIGLRLNLTVITLQANHTFSKYPVTTLGVGISLR